MIHRHISYCHQHVSAGSTSTGTSLFNLKDAIGIVCFHRTTLHCSNNGMDILITMTVFADLYGKTGQWAIYLSIYIYISRTGGGYRVQYAKKSRRGNGDGKVKNNYYAIPLILEKRALHEECAISAERQHDTAGCDLIFSSARDKEFQYDHGSCNGSTGLSNLSGVQPLIAV